MNFRPNEPKKRPKMDPRRLLNPFREIQNEIRLFWAAQELAQELNLTRTSKLDKTLILSESRDIIIAIISIITTYC